MIHGAPALVRSSRPRHGSGPRPRLDPRRVDFVVVLLSLLQYINGMGNFTALRWGCCQHPFQRLTLSGSQAQRALRSTARLHPTELWLPAWARLQDGAPGAAAAGHDALRWHENPNQQYYLCLPGSQRRPDPAVL